MVSIRNLERTQKRAIGVVQVNGTDSINVGTKVALGAPTSTLSSPNAAIVEPKPTPSGPAGPLMLLTRAPLVVNR